MRKEVLSPWLAVYVVLTYLIFGCAGLYCNALALSSCGEAGLLFDVVHGLLIVKVSFVVEYRLQRLPWWLTGK